MLGVQSLHSSKCNSLVCRYLTNGFLRSIFNAAYWPHFNQKLTKGFDPALIYSEFLGVIEV